MNRSPNEHPPGGTSLYGGQPVTAKKGVYGTRIRPVFDPVRQESSAFYQPSTIHHFEPPHFQRTEGTLGPTVEYQQSQQPSPYNVSASTTLDRVSSMSQWKSSGCQNVYSTFPSTSLPPVTNSPNSSSTVAGDISPWNSASHSIKKEVMSVEDRNVDRRETLDDGEVNSKKRGSYLEMDNTPEDNAVKNTHKVDYGSIRLMRVKREVTSPDVENDQDAHQSAPTNDDDIDGVPLDTSVDASLSSVVVPQLSVQKREEKRDEKKSFDNMEKVPVNTSTSVWATTPMSHSKMCGNTIASSRAIGSLQSHASSTKTSISNNSNVPVRIAQSDPAIFSKDAKAVAAAAVSAIMRKEPVSIISSDPSTSHEEAKVVAAAAVAAIMSKQAVRIAPSDPSTSPKDAKTVAAAAVASLMRKNAAEARPTHQSPLEVSRLSTFVPIVPTPILIQTPKMVPPPLAGYSAAGSLTSSQYLLVRTRRSRFDTAPIYATTLPLQTALASPIPPSDKKDPEMLRLAEKEKKLVAKVKAIEKTLGVKCPDEKNFLLTLAESHQENILSKDKKHNEKKKKKKHKKKGKKKKNDKHSSSEDDENSEKKMRRHKKKKLKKDVDKEDSPKLDSPSREKSRHHKHKRRTSEKAKKRKRLESVSDQKVSKKKRKDEGDDKEEHHKKKECDKNAKVRKDDETMREKEEEECKKRSLDGRHSRNEHLEKNESMHEKRKIEKDRDTMEKKGDRHHRREEKYPHRESRKDKSEKNPYVFGFGDVPLPLNTASLAHNRHNERSMPEKQCSSWLTDQSSPGKGYRQPLHHHQNLGPAFDEHLHQKRPRQFSINGNTSEREVIRTTTDKHHVRKEKEYSTKEHVRREHRKSERHKSERHKSERHNRSSSRKDPSKSSRNVESLTILKTPVDSVERVDRADISSSDELVEREDEEDYSESSSIGELVEREDECYDSETEELSSTVDKRK